MTAILVTGSAGLIGHALCGTLARSGHRVTGLDRSVGPHTSLRHTLSVADDMQAMVSGFGGIVHLAGLTRVKWGEIEPERCWSENVDITQKLVAACQLATRPPWFIYASSREVYGEAATLPVDDDAPLAPINIYGRSKAAAEAIVAGARAMGMRTAILRFSTVYGAAGDHPDRLFPALMQRAIAGEAIELNGFDIVVDPTWIDDAVAAVVALIARLEDGQSADGPLLISAGLGFSLGEIAARVLEATDSASAVIERPARTYDTQHFIGAPRRARQFLGWSAQTSLEEGLARYAKRLDAR